MKQKTEYMNMIINNQNNQVHPEWNESYVQFIKDLGPSPSRRCKLYKIDDLKPFQPDNCIWADPNQIIRLDKQKEILILQRYQKSQHTGLISTNQQEKTKVEYTIGNRFYEEELTNKQLERLKSQLKMTENDTLKEK